MMATAGKALATTPEAGHLRALTDLSDVNTGNNEEARLRAAVNFAAPIVEGAVIVFLTAAGCCVG